MTASKAETLYEEEVGVKALTRQQREAEHRYVCCGERKLNGHHVLCPNYVEPVADEQPALF